MRSLSALFAFSLASAALGQAPAEHLRLLLERMATAKSYHAQARTDMIGEGGKVLATEQSEAWCQGLRLRSTIGQRTTISTEREFLFIDLAEKQMVYQQRSAAFEAPPAQDLSTQLQELITESSGGLSLHAQDERTLTLRMIGDPDEGYAYTDIVIRNKDHLLERIVYHLQGPARELGKGQMMDRVEVTYTRLQLGVDVPATLFDMRPWVRRGQDGRMVAAPGHEDLELIQNDEL